MFTYFLRFGQLFNIILVIAILATASFYQYAFFEPPCALCQLQRMGFIGIALGYVLNLQNGFRSSHYAVTLLSCVFMLICTLLHVLLHIVPGDPGFGDVIFGLHFYTLAYIATLYFTFSTALFLIKTDQFQLSIQEIKIRFAPFIFYLLLLCVLVNLASTFLQCGFQTCPSDPKKYLYFIHY